MALNWLAGIATTIIGWIGMFYNLEDYEELYVNLALSLIPIFYTILFNLLLTIVEARINKVAE
jgi:flagellar motor component MotA